MKKKVYILGYSGKTLNEIFGVFESKKLAEDAINETRKSLTGASHDGWYLLEKILIQDDSGNAMK